MIPEIDPGTDYLPIGIHSATLDELEKKYGYNKKRKKILDGLRKVIAVLKDCNCKSIIIDGSFITLKSFPSDLDGCFYINGMDIAKLWNKYPEFNHTDPKSKHQQLTKYDCEFYPTGAPSMKAGKTLLEFFQSDRDNVPKGVLQINI